MIFRDRLLIIKFVARTLEYLDSVVMDIMKDLVSVNAMLVQVLRHKYPRFERRDLLVR